ncbi:unnamed protein product, partial [Cuscuta campestris]
MRLTYLGLAVWQHPYWTGMPWASLAIQASISTSALLSSIIEESDKRTFSCPGAMMIAFGADTSLIFKHSPTTTFPKVAPLSEFLWVEVPDDPFGNGRNTFWLSQKLKRNTKLGTQ